eukprot:1290678-Pleurochrysis_carterae.AAC.2
MDGVQPVRPLRVATGALVSMLCGAYTRRWGAAAVGALLALRRRLTLSRSTHLARALAFVFEKMMRGAVRRWHATVVTQV